MRIGIFFPSVEHGTLDDMVGRFGEVADEGFASAWLPQSRSFDALTALAVIGREVPGVELGTAVVPTFPRHPLVLGTQALTANAAVGGRLRLGIGLSHRAAIEGAYGLSYDRPARHMSEYLSILMPLLRDRAVDVAGETLVGRAQVTVPGAEAPPVYLAALQARMLHLAGAVADGTITWCTGPVTVEKQIVPQITKAAADAGRPSPRVLVALPCCVTDDEADGRAKADRQLEGYGQIPVYRAVLDAEGAGGPGDVSVVGDEAGVAAQLRRLEAVGATDFIAILCGTEADRARTRRHLASLAS
ncbi:MAG TPA: TIGR03564 family F420-dependent LLM class oxidoreductase [Acidimicrobiales bacterium]|nr:TIGR03564 family F420-dependent LLM class oxidoreductase [Acidimicrobiales bacterium]